MKDFIQKAFSGFARKMGSMSFVLLFLSFAFASQVSAAIVINEVYAGGGNAGATISNDFVELYNNGSTDVNISGYSIQTSPATSTMGNFIVCALPTTGDTVIEPGTYFLVQFAGSGTLSGANATCTVNLAISGSKVVLASNTTALPVSAIGCPTGTTIVDFVGSGGANCFEGAGAAPRQTNTTSIQRTPIGTDTNNNNADFTTGAPSPMAAVAGTTAAGASLSGRVATESGRGIWRATLVLTGGTLEGPVYAVTDFYGNYNFNDIPAGETYALSVFVKGYKFNQTSIVVNLNEDVTDAHFIGTPKQRIGGLK